MKGEILTLLRESKGHYLSGEEISRQLGVSRTAIWKHIQALREEGYSIESQSRLGYSLVGAPSQLLPAEIQENLETNRLGQRVEYYPSLVSTNITARELAVGGAAEGTIVVAEGQTGGKGRLGRVWTSPEGKGLWMSLILRPAIPPMEASKLTMLAAVAVVKAIEGLSGLIAGIKWPNDVLLQGKKVCGILTEMSAEQDCVNFVILGLGININLASEDFPEDYRQLATSLAVAGGREYSRVEFCRLLLQELELLYDDFLEGGFAALREAWKERSVSLDCPVTITTLRESWQGYAEDIDEDGLLMVRDQEGQLHRVSAGDVSLRSGAGDLGFQGGKRP